MVLVKLQVGVRCIYLFYSSAPCYEIKEDPLSINLKLLFENQEDCHSDDSDQESIETKESDTEFTPQSISNNFSPPKKSTSFDDIDIHIEYVESSQNIQGNYNNYVYNTLKSTLPLKKLDYSDILEEKKLLLQELTPENKKTLILDLDETLIHSDFNYKYSGHDSIINFNYNDEIVEVPIFFRPGLMEFLQKISENFEILIFTASIKEYADAVLNYLDPENKFFQHRFYRQNCISVKNKIFIKDLRIFVNRKQENIIIVDNSLYSFTNQISNGVLINSFYNDKADRELYNVLNYLKNYLQNTPDVRSLNEKIFNFKSILNDIA
jgi:CTD small phosphatase-like protein 2